MRNVERGVAFSATVAALAALPACASGKEPFKTPDGTCTIALHNAKMNPELVEQTHQSFSFTVRIARDDNGETVVLCNLTEQPIDKNKFGAIVNYFAGIGSPEHQTFPNQLEARLELNGEEQQWMTLVPIDRKATEHNFTLIRSKDDMPRAYKNAPAVTLFLPDGINNTQQTVSIVIRPDGNLSFDQESGIYVEVCQSMVLVLPPADANIPDDPVDAAMLNRMVQEIYCNSWGQAALYAANGKTYDEYVQFIQKSGGGYYSVGTKLFFVDLFTVTPEQYEQMKLALQG